MSAVDRYNFGFLGHSLNHGYVTNVDQPGPEIYRPNRPFDTIMVGVDANSEVLVVPPDEACYVTTPNLVGCTAVAITADQTDGRRLGYLQHHTSLNREHSAAVLAQAARLVAAGRPNLIRAVILTPNLEPDYLGGILSTIARVELGKDAILETYSYWEEVASKRSARPASLQIDFGSDGQSSIIVEPRSIYQTAQAS